MPIRRFASRWDLPRASSSGATTRQQMAGR